MALKKTSVLLVEDEPTLARVVCDFLQLKGYEVKSALNGDQAIEAFSSSKPDICLLDVMLPGIDGFQIAQKIRTFNTKIPILFLTAKDQIKDIESGFESGGNDYMKKPFNMRELMLRMENLLRMTSANAGDGKGDRTITLGQYVYDPITLALSTENFCQKLSYKESEILNELYRNINNVTLRKNLLLKVWGDDSFFTSRNLDVYMRKLRHHFRYDKNIEIITLRSVGYHFSVR